MQTLRSESILTAHGPDWEDCMNLPIDQCRGTDQTREGTGGAASRLTAQAAVFAPMEKLSADRLYRCCEPEVLDFHTTAELPDLERPLGQDRALGALEFGVGMQHEGYNLYVMGSTGLGKRATVHAVLEQRARQAPPPPDWCYIHNFKAPHKPRVLRLPPGTGLSLQRDMLALVRTLLGALPAAFETNEYRARVQAIKDDFKTQEERALAEVTEYARGVDIMLMRTPVGFSIAPLRNGEMVGPEDFEKLSGEEKRSAEQRSEDVRERVGQVMQRVAVLHREHEQRIEQIGREVARATVELHVGEIGHRYRAQPEVSAFLDEVRRDATENVDDFRRYAAENKAPPDGAQRLSPFNRYYVNVLVDNSGGHGAPVIHEDHPTFQNLVGRTEHLAQFGTLLTDFTLIKSGALHRANGGYLVVDAHKLLTQAFSWEALKRALRAREVRIQSLEQMLSLASTISLEPEPIPLDLKVVLVGDRLLYYLLSQYDPEFALLFKVETDFAEDLDRTPESSRLYARLIATLQRREKLRPMDSGAVGRLIEHAARRAQDGEKLSLHMESLLDVLREADYWAQQAGNDVVMIAHVERAIAERIHRADQLRERVHESILRNLRLVDTSGTRTGQINGLAVYQVGAQLFGHPSRITATARLGDGSVVDIEREVELGGPTHSKGVLILSSYLASRFSRDEPLSLSASLVFEQSYGQIEGDSASVAELCVLESALSGLPLRQDLAITGSVNQLGAVQAIGGVNEKIEGFFDICRARGLSGSQGVIIPAANIKHLMLRKDVVEAEQQGRFHVYAITHVDQAMELFTGRPAGVRDAKGQFPEGSINGAVQNRMHELSSKRREFGQQARGADAKAAK